MFVQSIFSSDSGGAVDVGDIGHSLRFKSGYAPGIGKTVGAGGSPNQCWFSAWVKRGILGVQQGLFQGRVDGNNQTYLQFNASNQLEFYHYVSGTAQVAKVTSAVYRDPTSWLHVFVAIDTTLATAEDRFQIWVNGVRITAWTTNTNTYPQNNAVFWGSPSWHNIGCLGASGEQAWFFDGFMARVCFGYIQTATPSNVGYFNTQINEWVSKSQSQIKSYVDAGSVNSFMLDFDVGTNLTTLGTDKSSKGNNWTLNNFSLTAGTSYDHMLDVPGNSYATLNPLVVPELATSFSSGNLQFSGAGQVVGTIPLLGDSYFEYQMTNATASMVGVCPVGATTRGGGGAGVTNSVVYSSSSGIIYLSGSSVGTFASYTSSDVIGIQYQRSTGYVSFYKNNVFQATVTVPTSVDVVPYALGNTGATGALIFGQGPFQTSATYDSASGGYFRYTPPSGYKALCQRNMPTPAILNPEAHMDVVTYTGNGIQDRSLTGWLFDLGLGWLKKRGSAGSHVLVNSVVGGTKQLFSNLTDAEQTNIDITNGFTAGGLILGDNVSGTGSTNENGATYVGWGWKAGGAAVTNNAGSISSQVSANVDAGFSIVTYTGAGANATVGHGLGKAPGLVIVKNRQSIQNWAVYHKDLTSAAYYLNLNGTSAQTSNATVWNSTAPTSSVFSIGTKTDVNNSQQCVAYCFAEIPGFSKIGSYLGNGSTDGPYIDCGGKVKFLLIKRVDVAGSWVILDTARNTYNVAGTGLWADLISAESNFTTGIDVIANGFKLRENAASLNASGATYIYYAVADVAGKYSLGR